MQAEEEVTVMIKGKRSKRPRPASPILLNVTTSGSTATELGVRAGSCGSGSAVTSDVSGSSDRRTPSPFNSGEVTDEEEQYMANCLILLAKGQLGQMASQPAPEAYQCRTCNKSFPSFQALGGHRASHRKPNKPGTQKPLRDKQEDIQSSRDDRASLSLQAPNGVLGCGVPNKSCKVHECSTCGAEFASGQALGGHMRRHRPFPAVPSGGLDESAEAMRPRNLLSLDLNFPAPEDDCPTESKVPFAPEEEVMVFSTSPMVDCHY